MKAALWIALIVASCFLLDRLCLWMESRGWIYWRKKHASSTTAGVALLELQKLLEPQKRHVIQVKTEHRKSEDGSGDGDAGDVTSRN